jgi:hypothetical protein
LAFFVVLGVFDRVGVDWSLTTFRGGEDHVHIWIEDIVRMHQFREVPPCLDTFPRGKNILRRENDEKFGTI